MFDIKKKKCYPDHNIEISIYIIHRKCENHALNYNRIYNIEIQYLHLVY